MGLLCLPETRRAGARPLSSLRTQHRAERPSGGTAAPLRRADTRGQRRAALGVCAGGGIGQAGSGREVFLLYFSFLDGKSNRKFLRGAPHFSQERHTRAVTQLRGACVRGDP